MTSLASDCCCNESATWSRQALASLSTRVGRFVSLSNATEHRACACGTAGGGGATISTAVFALTVCPLSSLKLQVIATLPVGAPVEEYAAEAPLPLMVPVAAE